MLHYGCTLDFCRIHCNKRTHKSLIIDCWCTSHNLEDLINQCSRFLYDTRFVRIISGLRNIKISGICMCYYQIFYHLHLNAIQGDTSSHGVLRVSDSVFITHMNRMYFDLRQIYTYSYTRTSCTHTSTPTHIRAHMHTITHIHAHTCTYAYVHTHTRRHTQVHIYNYTYMGTQIYTHKYTQMYVCTVAYTHTHILK